MSFADDFLGLSWPPERVRAWENLRRALMRERETMLVMPTDSPRFGDASGGRFARRFRRSRRSK